MPIYLQRLDRCGTFTLNKTGNFVQFKAIAHGAVSLAQGERQSLCGLAGGTKSNDVKECLEVKKRLLASLMSLCLLVGLLPCHSTGGGGTQDGEPPVSEPVTSAEADGYTEWTSIDSLPTSGTYRLTDNVTIKAYLF